MGAAGATHRFEAEGIRREPVRDIVGEGVHTSDWPALHTFLFVLAISFFKCAMATRREPDSR